MASQVAKVCSKLNKLPEIEQDALAIIQSEELRREVK